MERNLSSKTCIRADMCSEERGPNPDVCCKKLAVTVKRRTSNTGQQRQHDISREGNRSVQSMKSTGSFETFHWNSETARHIEPSLILQ